MSHIEVENPRGLVLMRHGLTTCRDNEEVLSKIGVEQIWRTAKDMVLGDLRPDFILSSRAPRAKQTAQLLADLFQQAGWKITLREDDRVEYGNILEALSSLGTERVILVVGHKDTIDAATEKLTSRSFAPRFAEAVLIDCMNIPGNSWQQAFKSNNNRWVENIPRHWV